MNTSTIQMLNFLFCLFVVASATLLHFQRHVIHNIITGTGQRKPAYFDRLYFRDIMCIVVRTVLGIPGNIIQQSTKYFTPIVFSNFLPSSVSLPCTSSYYLDHNTRHQQLWCFFIQNRVPRLSLSYFMIHFLCRIFMIHFTRGFEDAANYMARRKFRNTKRTAPYYEWESLVCLQQCIYILFIQS